MFRLKKRFYFGSDPYEKKFRKNALLYFLNSGPTIKTPRQEFFNKDFASFVPLRFFLIVVLVCGGLFSSVWAQNIEFGTIRTKETPGFFMIEVYPGKNSQPMEIQDIYVKNYNESESETYKELISILNEVGNQVIEFSEVATYESNPRNRLIFLGEPYGDYLNFQPQDKNMVIEDFEQFSRLNLGPVYAQDITANFGGNINEVFPEKIKYLGNQPEIFIGKFRRPLKTRVEINGISKQGAFSASAPIQLQTSIFAQSPEANRLPLVWEAYWKAKNAPEKEDDFWDPRWLSFFPLVLGIVGALLVLLSLRSYFKGTKKTNSFRSPSFRNMPPSYPPSPYSQTPPVRPSNTDQTPSAPPTPFDLGPNAPKSDLPFEVEKRVQDNINR